MDFLIRKNFTTHSGKKAFYKIECDALTDEEILTFASIIAARFKFKYVIGVSQSVSRITSALYPYITDERQDPVLIVDDVFTTGASMEAARTSNRDIGVVLFSRGPCPDWVYPVFQLWGR